MIPAVVPIRHILFNPAHSRSINHCCYYRNIIVGLCITGVFERAIENEICEDTISNKPSIWEDPDSKSEKNSKLLLYHVLYPESELPIALYNGNDLL